MLRELFAIVGCVLALCLAVASVASASPLDGPAKRTTETARVSDRFNLADRMHVRVFEDGSARICYRVRVWPLAYRRTFGYYTRVCAGVGVPW